MTNLSTSTSKFNFAGVPPRKKSLGLAKNSDAASIATSSSGNQQQLKSALQAQQQPSRNISSNHSRTSESQMSQYAALNGEIASTTTTTLPLKATTESNYQKHSPQQVAASHHKPAEKASYKVGWSDEHDIDQLMGAEENKDAVPQDTTLSSDKGKRSQQYMTKIHE